MGAANRFGLGERSAYLVLAERFARADLRQLGRTMKDQLYSRNRTNVQALVGFMGRQDPTLAASTQGKSASHVKNALAWAMFGYGIPAIALGAEPGSPAYDADLQLYDWNTTAWQYQLLAKLSRIRQEANARVASARVVSYTADKLVFVRGWLRWGAWVFTNNLNATGPVTYRVAPPRPPFGKAWFDAISGTKAKLSRGLFTAPSADPAVLVLRTARMWPRGKAAAASPGPSGARGPDAAA